MRRFFSGIDAARGRKSADLAARGPRGEQAHDRNRMAAQRLSTRAPSRVSKVRRQLTVGGVAQIGIARAATYTDEKGGTAPYREGSEQVRRLNRRRQS